MGQKGSGRSDPQRPRSSTRERWIHAEHLDLTADERSRLVAALERGAVRSRVVLARGRQLLQLDRRDVSSLGMSVPEAHHVAQPPERPLSRGARVGALTAVIALVATSIALAGTKTMTSAVSSGCTDGAARLVVSTSPDRSGAAPLCAAELQGAVYVFVSNADDALYVRFFVDGTYLRTEHRVPLDLFGGTATGALPWDLSAIASGEHLLEAKVKRPSGVIESSVAVFTVTGALPPEASPSQSSPPPPAPSPSSQPEPTLDPSTPPTSEPAPTTEPEPPATGTPATGEQTCIGLDVAPSASLEAVTSSASPGTTFCLAATTYRVPSGVTLQDGDILQGAGRAKTFIVGAGALAVLKSSSGAQVSVRSLDLSGGMGDSSCRPACGRAVFGNGASWILEDLRCHHNDNQCVGGGSAAITMRNSECDHNGGGSAFNTDGTTRSAACIKRASTGAGRLLVTGSYVHDNYWAGIWCDFCTEGPFIVENSVVTGNVSKGISYEVSGGWGSNDQAIVRGNVIRDNGLGDTRTISAGITCNSCAELTITGNRFGGNASGRAVGFADADRGSWGDLYAITVTDNELSGDTVNCTMVGVSCGGNV